MPLRLPDGIQIAVAIGVDFDAHCLWKGAFDLTSPGYLSRGEFGAEVGVPRLLGLFRRYEVRATFCTPGHSLVTFPDKVHDVMEAGHEVASHGCYHENVSAIDEALERELMETQLEQYAKVVGGCPRGYRSPAWDVSQATLALLEEHGFEWDSSLMGREFEPYHPRPVHVDWLRGNTFGPPSAVLEIPPSWYLDDGPPQEFIAGRSAGLGDHDLLYRRWKDIFDYAHENETAAVYPLTIHPQCSGRSHHLMVLERLVEYMRTFDDVWFASLSDVFDCWDEGASD